MAKVLSSISLDAPAAPVSANVNDTFAFSGTPTLSGGGGAQAYDFKWEVNNGGGYVTIAASGTGLITSGTNPLIGTKSQTQNSITVTCDQAGSYTIRMAGAPTSGGSYTVLSATQTVTVSAASVPFSADLSAPSITVAAQSVTRLNDFQREMTSPSLGFTALAAAWNVTTAFTAALSAPAFALAAQAVTRLNAFAADMSAPAFSFAAQSLTRLNAFIAGISTAAFGLVGQAVDYVTGNGGGGGGGGAQGCKGLPPTMNLYLLKGIIGGRK